MPNTNTTTNQNQSLQHEGSHSSMHEGSHSMTIAEDRPFTEESTMHQMDGIPTYLAITGVILVILCSHYFVNKKSTIGKNKQYWQFNLLKFGFLNTLVKKSYFPLLIQSVSMILFNLVIVAGFIGSQQTNIAPVLTWTWWWVLLIFVILGLGTTFCAVCPWEGFSSLISSFSLSSRIKKLGFEHKWPKFARNIYPALILFVLLTWYELGFDVTRSPMMTAIMAVVMVSMAILAALIFEKRAFCRYACIVGRISGLYALFSPIELRPKTTDVCRTCTGKECYNGSETQTGCPTNLFPGNLNKNTYCTLCTECIRACPHDNLAINIRPPATDLYDKRQYKWDEAILAIVLLALTSFHGITMTPAWEKLNNSLRVEMTLGPKPVFTMLMIIITIAPVLIFGLTAFSAKKFTKESNVSVGKIFRAFAYSVIPIALFYHLAHNGMHFFMEAQNIIPLLSDPFGWGWNLFGTAGKTYGSLLTLKTIWYIQLGLIVIGHIYGVIIADRIAKNLFKDHKLAMKSLIPLIVTMILFSSFSIWLIAQPMHMRSGM